MLKFEKEKKVASEDVILNRIQALIFPLQEFSFMSNEILRSPINLQLNPLLPNLIPILKNSVCVIWPAMH